MEQRPLAQVAVVRLQRLGHGGIGDDLLDPRAVRLHHGVVELLGPAHDFLERHPRLDAGLATRAM